MISATTERLPTRRNSPSCFCWVWLSRVYDAYSGCYTKFLHGHNETVVVEKARWGESSAPTVHNQVHKKKPKTSLFLLVSFASFPLFVAEECRLRLPPPPRKATYGSTTRNALLMLLVLVQRTTAIIRNKMKDASSSFGIFENT